MRNVIERPGAAGIVVLALFCCLLGIIVWFSLQVDTAHAHSWVEQHIPAFWSIFGFVAAAVILLAIAGLGRLGLQVGNDFYERTIDDSKSNGQVNKSGEEK